eukprot:scaffold244570_cov37-Tisochrysis_lutea.AAC.1
MYMCAQLFSHAGRLSYSRWNFKTSSFSCNTSPLLTGASRTWRSCFHKRTSSRRCITMPLAISPDEVASQFWTTAHCVCVGGGSQPQPIRAPAPHRNDLSCSDRPEASISPKGQGGKVGQGGI